MKKIIAIALTLAMLCGAVTVFADTELVVPSKTTDDLVSFEATVENPVAGKTVSVEIADNDASEKALEKAQAAGTVESYFGEETAKAIAAVLGEDVEISMDELTAVVLKDYEEANGVVTVNAQFSTPYEKDEKVAVGVGIPVGEDVNWTIFEGIGQEDGNVVFVVDAETAKAIAADYALLAVCSSK